MQEVGEDGVSRASASRASAGLLSDDSGGITV